ncbi:MAG: type IX secretion system sortase PorU [Bacteroidota bacterium]|nr:type IX secretion system sortase PorU [Bacteroidota bacterium]
MKHVSFIFFLLIPFLASAQTHWTFKGNLNWQSNLRERSIEGQSAGKTLYFEGAAFKDKQALLPIFRKSFSLNGPGTFSAELNPITVKVVNPTGLSDQLMITDDFTLSFGVSKDRDIYTGWVEITPLRKQHSQLEQLQEFELDLFFVPEIKPVNPSPNYTYNSILEQGTIYKISITTRGIYKIDKAFLESKLKINLTNLDPRNIRIFGNGGQKLPEANSIVRHDDLVENKIVVLGEEDGIFNDQDFILFYAPGPDKLTYNNSSEEFDFEKNTYSESAHYFIKIDNQRGARISTQSIQNQPTYTSTTSLQYYHYEKDLINLLSKDPCNHPSGQSWVGEELSNSRELNLGAVFNINNIVTDKRSRLKALMYTRCPQSSNVHISVNGITVTKIAGSTYYSCVSRYASPVNFNDEISLTDNVTQCSIKYPQTPSSSEAWFDWLSISAWTQNSYVGRDYYIFDPDAKTASVTKFELRDVNPQVLIWDITNPVDIKLMESTFQNNSLSFLDATQNKTAQYIAFQIATVNKVPEFIEQVANQNLHGIDKVDAMIIYHPLFKEDALRLAEHRKSYSGYTVATADIHQVYNEFSSGNADPTAIRDFSRMLYLRNPQFRFLTLFGDASYDYREFITSLPDENFVPTYQTQESLYPLSAYPSDDYFGLLDEIEGDDLNGKMDISIGRLLSRTKDESKTLVDKIIRYDTDPLTLEDWRLNLIFSADDEDGNIHLSDMERVSTESKVDAPVYNQQKIYLDAYEQITTPGGERYPDVNKAINASFFQGALAMTYMGHGGPTGLAQERIMQENDIKSWDNYYRLPLLVTATCSFNAFEDAGKTNAGEYAVHNKKGGVIALYSTVRAVYADDNFQLTRAVYNHLFDKINGVPITIGEILRIAKNENSSGGIKENSRKFMLFGDPSQTLAYPKLEQRIVSINDKPLSAITDTIRALQKVTVKGFISDGNGSKVSNFNGVLYATVFDKEITLRTRGNDPSSTVINYKIQKNIIFKGNSDIKNGDWEFTFIVPKDINYNFGQGKISLYASDLKNRDAAGYTDAFVVGGFIKDTLVDDDPPVVELFLNDENFRNGGITDENPKIFAKISDDLGINISGTSIGHDMTAVLDNNTQSPIILNNYFKSAINDYRYGEVEFPLKDLSIGKHTLTLTAWDISNKKGQATIEFYVIDGDDIHIQNAYNFPNPFNNQTQFQFEMNQSGLPLEITIYIYSVSGSIVKTIQSQLMPDGYRIQGLTWDGRNDAGSDLGNGVYIYQIHVRVDTGSEIITKRSDFQKLVILK